MVSWWGAVPCTSASRSRPAATPAHTCASTPTPRPPTRRWCTSWTSASTPACGTWACARAEAMKRSLLVVSAAHVLLLGLLYADHLARQGAHAAAREREDRQRHEQLLAEAVEERRRERLSALPTDAGVEPFGGELDGKLGDAGGGERRPGARRGPTQRGHIPGGGARGASAERLVHEDAVLAELLGAKPVPA